MATYKAVMRQALEYVSDIWSPLAFSNSTNKLQVMHNAAVRTATDAHKTQAYNICIMKNSHFPYTSTYNSHLTIQTENHPSHPLHKHTTYFNTPR